MLDGRAKVLGVQAGSNGLVRRAEGQPRVSKLLVATVIVAATVCVALCVWVLLAELARQGPRCSYLQEGASTYLACE